MGLARDELEAEYRRESKGDLFAPLMRSLEGGPDAPTYAEIARALRMTEPAVRKAAQRIRRRFARLIRRRVAATISEPGDVEDELRELMSALTP